MFRVNDLIMPIYSCPMCRKTFAKFEDANFCIGNHITPVVIESFSDIDINGAETIVVVNSDGSKGVYNLEPTARHY